MDIKRSGSRAPAKGPAEYFTGAVRIDPLFEAPEPARVRGASVTFEPGARTAWHTHPLGQTFSSRRGSVGRSVGAVPSRKSGLTTRFGFRPAKSIGMGPRPRRR